ncbi:N-acetylmuramoyl-L-alanine amidase [Candidatus Chloroploca sp. M-50]|uniref:N-acetylmuramoyl-L-alanine amidase n=1 Tax=Candidatus Chloroploca mongolica TaxID=2528176 RepID=A0ABS4DGZ5_9CHLR|nr:N-acetylmuramoyl-L-alanine amidase [Candidatus Chloroploca mongolica]MBP1468717.1 N-acetylmuramoyl-L-alanine amidase [Candidatus Chloroploca mongolica]
MSDEWMTDLLPFDTDAYDDQVPACLGPFLYEGRAFSPADFERYVQAYDFGPVKPDFLVLHHTAIPSASWARYPSGAVWDANEEGKSPEARIAKRLRQLEGIANHYNSNLGWDRGPHLFIDDLAIYTFSPMAEIGIHAAKGNAYQEPGRLHYSIGIEVVGYYEHVPWPEPVLANVAAAVCSLKAALGTFDFVSGPRAGQIAEHRMFNKPGCPGAAIRPDFYLPRFRQVWAQRVGVDLEPISADSPLLAPPRATVAQALAFIQRRPHGEYTSDDLSDTILPAYWRLCAEVGLDPLLAIAQLIHETDNLCSWWAARPRRNPAGLGVTGRSSPSKPLQSAWVERDGTWREGLCFASWQDEAIPAHIGRLLAYALSDEQANEAQRALIGHALALRPLPAQNRGVAPTLGGLNGRWAVPGTTYAHAIARIANGIIAC